MDYRSIIESRYNRANWQGLLYDIFRQRVQFWQQPQLVPVDESMAKRALYTGKITLPDGHIIAIYEVELSDSVVIERNRAGIRNLLCTNWRGMGCAGAFMFCFRQNEAVLRFSYVSESFVFAEDGSLTKESTDTKRFTYLLGEGHRSRTAIKQFEDLKNSALDLKAITKAFSVEALSDLFFKEYKKQYEDIIEFITGKRMVKVANKWEEQVTGQPCREIMQEFSQFPDAEKAVRDYVKKLMGRLVFIQFLQKKGWMGCSAGEAWNDGDKEFVQNLFANTSHKNTFVDDVLEPLFNDINTKRNGDITSSQNVGNGIKIPYLNGGLFEKDDYDKTNFPLPAKFMKNLLDFFASYNFTIDENDPDDAEIGVDPEMLGRIFENLLEDNKDKGAFYTPKEIVQYMCRESLVAYLQTDIYDNQIKDSIRQFVTTYDASVLSEELKETVDQKLKDVKICDPAIGSGAFPMGLLRELYACRKAIEGIDDETAVSIKTHIIQNNIYGVDIEKGAVDIARLRFWLALIVDEKNPHALPNMDFKIMQGNSLLEQYEGIELSGMSLDEQKKRKAKKGQAWQATLAFDEQYALDNIQHAIKEYYLTDDHNAKVNLRGIINENVRSYIVNLKGCTPDIQNKIAKLPIPNDQFFLWHIYFKEVFDKGGFDIVIGNPPYVFARNSEEKGMTDEAKAYYYKNFKLAQYQVNLYHLFVEQGTNLLAEGGVFSYIIPNNWMTINTNKEFRKYILTKCDVQILNFYQRVFESADVDSSIIIYRNINAESSVRLSESVSKEEFNLVSTIPASILLSEKDYIINIERYKNDSFTDVMIKIESNSLPIKDNYASVKCGIKAYQKGKGKPAQTEEVKKNRVFHSLTKDSATHFKYIEGVDVKRYNLTWVSAEYINWGKHLAEPRGNWDLFSTPRILVRQIPSKPPYCINACYTDEVLINDLNSMNIIDIKCNPLYLLAVINSRAVSFWFEHKFGKLQRGLFPQFKINELASFPIPFAAAEDQKKIAALVEKKMSSLMSGDKTQSNNLDKEIDVLIFDLFKLETEDINIIENCTYEREQ